MVVATDVYLDKIYYFFAQFLYITRWKLELGTFYFTKVLVLLGQLWEKVSKFSAN